MEASGNGNSFAAEAIRSSYSYGSGRTDHIIHVNDVKPFSDCVNFLLRHESSLLKGTLPINTETLDITKKVQDGILFMRLIEMIDPTCLLEYPFTMMTNLSFRQRLENIDSVMSAAERIGCELTGINSALILDEKLFPILELLYQIFNQLAGQTSVLKSYSHVDSLLLNREVLSGGATAANVEVLLRWANFYFEVHEREVRVHGLGADSAMLVPRELCSFFNYIDPARCPELAREPTVDVQVDSALAANYAMTCARALGYVGPATAADLLVQKEDVLVELLMSIYNLRPSKNLFDGLDAFDSEMDEGAPWLTGDDVDPIAAQWMRESMGQRDSTIREDILPSSIFGSPGAGPAVHEAASPTSPADGASDLDTAAESPLAAAYSCLINECLGDNEHLTPRLLPLRGDGSDLFRKVHDGVILTCLINCIFTNVIKESKLLRTIDGQLWAIDKRKTLRACLKTLRLLGAEVGGISESEILRGKRGPVLSVLWHLLRAFLLLDIDTSYRGDVAALQPVRKSVTFDAALFTVEDLLLRWVNFSLANTGSVLRVSGFGGDMMDPAVHCVLMFSIDKHRFPLPAEDASDLALAAHAVTCARELGVDVCVQAEDLLEVEEKLKILFLAQVFNAVAESVPRAPVQPKNEEYLFRHLHRDSSLASISREDVVDMTAAPDVLLLDVFKSDSTSNGPAASSSITASASENPANDDNPVTVAFADAAAGAAVVGNEIMSGVTQLFGGFGTFFSGGTSTAAPSQLDARAPGKTTTLDAYSSETQEARAFTLYINKYLNKVGNLQHLLPLDPDLLDIFIKLSDGLILIELINHVRSGTILAEDYTQYTTSMTSAQMDANVRIALTYAELVGCNVGGMGVGDIRLGRPSSILKFIYQLICSRLLSDIANEDGSLKCQEDLLDWVNEVMKVEGHETGSGGIAHFSHLRDPLVLSVVLHAINPAVPVRMAEEEGEGDGTASCALAAASTVLIRAQAIGVPVLIQAEDICAGNTRLLSLFVMQIFALAREKGVNQYL